FADEGFAQTCAFFFLAILAFFGRHDVDLPARQLGRQADVLAACADGLGQVLGVDHDVHCVLVFVDHDGFDMSWRERTNDELGRIVGPQDDIDLFTTKLVAHSRDSRAAHAYASADGIDTLVVSHHSNFGTHARIAGCRLDLEQTLLD